MDCRSVRAALLLGAAGILALSLPAATQGRRGGVEIEVVGGRDAAAREILVKLNRPAGPADLAAIGADNDADEVEPLGAGGLLRLRSRSRNITALLARLATRGDVLYAEPNYVVHALVQPNDVQFPQLWGLANAGQAINGVAGIPGADIAATQAWDLTVGSTATVVGVVDTGLDYNHPDLTANVWSAPSAFTVTVGGTPITCPAGSHGFNAIAMSCDPMDDHNHGTHVSGTIGAVGDNGTGVVGVNWTARLMGLKFLDASGSGTVADAIKVLEFAMQVKQLFAATGGANIRVLSNSWGDTAFSQALLDQVIATNAQEMLFVAAAGNSGLSNDSFPTYPASFNSPNVVAVAATTNRDDRAWFSNYGAGSVHLGAPGVDIFSTTIGNTYAFSSGTSMATPHVSGAAALVLSRCSLGTAELKDALVGSVDPVPALAGRTTSGGRLNVYSAVYSCVAPPTTPSGLTAAAGNGKVTLTWSSALGATSYTIKRSVTAGGPYDTVVSGLKAVQYVDTTVLNDTTYYYVVTARNSMGESGSSNEASATPRAPSDLLVTALSAPANLARGSTVSLSVTTKNQGGGTSNPSTTRLYLSDNFVQDSSDIELSGAQAVASLAPGASSSASLSIPIPTGMSAGRKYLIARADADNVLVETVEANNSRIVQVNIGPDLVVSALTAPSTAGAGSTMVVSDSIKNQGAEAAGASTTRFYLSANFVLDGSDVLLPGSRSVSGLASSDTNTGQATLTIPAGTATGADHLVAKADADDAVSEAQEANNTLARSIQVGPDLTVSVLTAPATAAAGASIAVSDTTVNQGAGGAGSSRTRFYLSTNTLLDVADTALNGFRAVPPLVAGGTSAGSTAVVIPSTTPGGQYYLLAKADADDTEVETQEGNNTRSRSISIGPDLRVTSATVTYSIVAGSTVPVTGTVANQGAGAASPSTTRFYLSTNFVVDGADVELPGSWSVPALAVGASSTATTQVTIPTGTAPGTYYLLIQADADDVVVEAQEGNNTAVKAVKVSSGP